MASETGASSKQPASTRDRVDVNVLNANKSLRMVLYNADRSGLIASDTSFRRLKTWMSREAEGTSADLRSPFFSSRVGNLRTWVPREELVESLQSEISKVEVGNRYFHELLTEVEDSQKKNISAQSSYLPWGIDGPDKVAEIYRDKPRSPELNERALKRAVDRVIALVPTNSIRMESIEDVVNHVRVNPHAVDQAGMDVHTNSGPPYFINPWKPSGSLEPGKMAESQAAFDFIVQRAKAQFELLNQGNTVPWNAVVAKRLAQKANIEKRKRIVIALEKAEPVIWKTFTPSLMEALKQVKLPGGARPFVAWNDLPSIDQEMQLILNNANQGNRVVIGGDYSGYDATLAPWLIQLAGDIIGQWVYKGQKMVSALAKSLTDGVQLITPNKIWEATPSSMKSGSGGTNMLDSIVNLLVLFYGEEVGAYKLINCCVQGDDFILDGIGADPDAIHSVAEVFGLEAHPDKQMYKRDALSFLQRIHLRGQIGGIGSVFRTFGSILSYERMMYRPDEWNSWVDIVRALSQLENTVFSPWFETLVKFVSTGDKYHLGADLPAIQVLEKGGDTANDWIQREIGKPSKSKDKNKLDGNGFELMAVNGVIRGEELPPWGSNARFSRVYRDRIK